MKCPKCSIGQLSGPTYRKKFKEGLPGTFEESLSYSCPTCGYAETRPCKDDPKTTAQAESKRYLREG